MEQEKTISGYCRYLDQSRIVLVELTDGEVTDVDCCYGSCPISPAVSSPKKSTDCKAIIEKSCHSEERSDKESPRE